MNLTGMLSTAATDSADIGGLDAYPPPVLVDHSGVVLTLPAAFAALNAVRSAIAHRRMSTRPTLPDIPAWLELADALEAVVMMSDFGHAGSLKVIGAKQLTAAEAATELDVGQRQVTRLARDGKLAGRKTRNGWLLDREAITAWKEGRHG